MFDTTTATRIGERGATELARLQGSIQAYTSAAALQAELTKRFPNGANALLYYEEQLAKLTKRQLELLGRAVQLVSVGHARPGEETACLVRIRLDARAVLTAVRFHVTFDPAKLQHVPLTTTSSVSRLDFKVETAAEGNLSVVAAFGAPAGERDPGVYDLGKIGFSVKFDCPTGLVELKIEGGLAVDWNGPAGPFEPIGGHIFVG